MRLTVSRLVGMFHLPPLSLPCDEDQPMPDWLRASVVAAWLLVAPLAVRAVEKIDFERDIRPLLADKCFACHGRDAEHREGGLRLDQREAALKGGDSGEKAIVSGQPEKSELV